MDREQRFEIFTVSGWIPVSREVYFAHKGPKRWKFTGDEAWHGGGGYDTDE